MVVDPLSPCLDEEALAALISGGLADGELRQAEAHLAGCATCRGVLVDAAYAVHGMDSLAFAATGRREVVDMAESGSSSQQSGFFATSATTSEGVAESRYDVVGEHARGGMGRILRARDTRLSRTVAIKELLQENEQAKVRFVREAKLTARLQHPAIVPVHDAGYLNTTGKLFYSMKLVSGESLSEVVQRAGSLRERLSLLSSVLTVADALAYAHSERVIHRDIKPANVLLGAFGETLVVDWGLAKELETEEEWVPAELDDPSGSSRSVRSDMTAVGSVLGTPSFMPPEQAGGLEVDQRADVYAIGAMLYFVVCAKPPYVGASVKDVLQQVLTTDPRPLLEREPQAPADLCAIVGKAMARQLDERYPSAKELAADLRRFLTGHLVSAREYSWRQLVAHWIGRHRTIAALSASFFLLVLVGSAAFLVREQSLRRQAQAESVRADAQSRVLLIEHGRRELAQGQPFRASTYLAEAYAQEPSNLELRYLVTEAARPLEAHVHTLLGHERDVVAVQFSADGSRVATGSTDETVRTWSASSGQALRVLRGPETTVEDVAWSPDGKWVASAERVICVWNAETGELLQRLNKPGFRLKFSLDGKWLAAGSMTGALRVWDTATWQQVVEAKPHGDRLAAIAFHPAGGQAVTASWDGLLTFWALPSWKPIRTVNDHRAAVTTAAFSADGRWLLSGDSEVTLHVRDARDGAIAHTIRLPEGSRGMNAFFTPDGRRIVTTTVDGVIRIWHATSGTLLAAVDAIVEGKLFDSDVSPDGSSVVTVGLRRGDLWRVADSPGYRIVRGEAHDLTEVSPAVYSRDGSRFAAGTDLTAQGAHALHIWDAKTGAELASWRVPSSTYTLAGSADLSRLVTGYAHEGATLWDATNGRLIATLEPAGHWVRTLAMSLDGSLVITGSDDGAIRFFHGDSGAPAGDPLKLEARVTALTLSPDQRQLAVTDSKGRARVYGLDSRALLLDVQAHPTWIEDIQYSADGAWLVTAGRQDHIAKTWDARTGALRSTLAGHGDNLVRASFSPEGARVATVSTDNTARLWDAATGQLLRVIRGPAYTARFSQDGSELLTTGTRDYMVIWDVSLDSRTPEAIAGLVGQRSPWQLEAGRLIPRADAP